jgi:hypothetical protein
LPQTLEPVLRRHEFFAGLDPEYLALIAGCARNVVFGDGTFLFREGHPAQTFYLVREGAVALEITAPSRVLTVQTLGAGQAIVVDARVPAVVVAAGLLMLRAPFLVVVVAAAGVAALLRLWGLAA